MKKSEFVTDIKVGGKTPEEIKRGLEGCGGLDGDCENCPYDEQTIYCNDRLMRDALAYTRLLESSRWELFDDLSTAYYGKVMYGLNDDGTVYSRYSCDTMSFEQAVDEFRRLIADE